MSVAQGLRLDLRQSQHLVLTPQLQQAIRLLQMSNFELAAAVDKEIAENPFLDRADTLAQHSLAREAAEQREPVDRTRSAANGENDWPTGGQSPATDQSLRLKRSASRSFDEDITPMEARLAQPKGMRDQVREQLAALGLDGKIRRLADALVDSLEDDGYLRETDESLAARLGGTPEQVAAARAAVQRCEPTGIAARDLRECLMIQLKERDRCDPAMQALLDNLPLLARADLPELMRRCGVDTEDLQDMIDEIKALDPRPGMAIVDSEPVSVIPDLFVYQGPGGKWRIELNSATLPKVLVDTKYFGELAEQTRDREAKDYLSERLQSANWLAKALDQRARTVLRVAKAVFSHQMGFLEAGAQRLRPLVLRDIAEVTGLHESTVSRATAEKYVATPHGTFPLKYFFTTAIASTSSGDEAHSAEAIRLQIKRLIEREDAQDVLSDDQIVVALRERGIAIARRTVAKYRESLGIASSVDRRRAKALMR